MSIVSPADRLAGLADRYWRYECAESTLTAVLAGEPSDATVLFREKATDYARRDAAAAAMLAELESIPVETLDDRDLETHRLLARELAAVRGHYAVDSHQRPWLLPLGPDFNTIFFANSTSISDVAGARLFVARLGSIAGFLDDLCANMMAGHAKGIRYPRVVLEGATENARAMNGTAPEDTPWYGPFKRSAAASDPEVRQQADEAATIIRDAILPGMARYAEMLAGPLMNGARETISCTDGPGGHDYYRNWVRYFTTTDDTPDAVHALGLTEVARLEGEMALVAADAGYAGDVAGYRRFLSEDPQFIAPDADTLRERLEIMCKRIDRRIPVWFSRIPRITYGVETIPLSMAPKLPPAYAQPSPGDNSSAGVFWITSLPERCPTHMHLPLALHEGWPGHLMHIALMQETQDLPAFRRNGSVKYTVYIEGWALYCETLGVEMGLYENPHQHFGRLEFEMWRALRLVVDTGIHWHDWSRQQAIDYMQARLSLSLETIEQEVDRYIAFPAQALAYQIGNLKIRELRSRAEAALGARFTARAFHEAVMSSGPVSLPLLEEIVDRWIARSLDAAPRAAA